MRRGDADFLGGLRGERTLEGPVDRGERDAVTDELREPLVVLDELGLGAFFRTVTMTIPAPHFADADGPGAERHLLLASPRDR
jgi:hypothetical protein